MLNVPVRDADKLRGNGNANGAAQPNDMRVTTIKLPVPINPAGRAKESSAINANNAPAPTPVVNNLSPVQPYLNAQLEQLRAQAVADAFRPLEQTAPTSSAISTARHVCTTVDACTTTHAEFPRHAGYTGMPVNQGMPINQSMPVNQGMSGRSGHGETTRYARPAIQSGKCQPNCCTANCWCKKTDSLEPETATPPIVAMIIPANCHQAFNSRHKEPLPVITVATCSPERGSICIYARQSVAHLPFAIQGHSSGEVATGTSW